MSKQHKWHKEIKAWADGQQVQYRTKMLTMNELQWTKWEDVGDINSPPAFFNDDDFEYRIKPQPKEPQYLYVYATSKGYQFALKHGAVEVGSLNEIANCIGKIKLEVDDNGTI